MGRETKTLVVRLDCDHHGGPEQERDAELTAEIEARLRDVLDEDRYAHLRPTIDEG